MALGVQKLTLFGISYGTKLALAYARAHPDRVERMALDSVLDPDDADAFGLEPYRRARAVARLAVPGALPRRDRRPRGATWRGWRSGCSAAPMRGLGLRHARAQAGRRR